MRYSLRTLLLIVLDIVVPLLAYLAFGLYGLVIGGVWLVIGSLCHFATWLEQRRATSIRNDSD